MVLPEEFARKCEDLAVRRMIESFDALDLGFERRGMLADMVYEHRLFVRGTGDENGTCVSDCIRDVLKKGLIFARMSAADGVRLVMDVADGILRMNDDRIGLGCVEVKDTGFVVIDPNDGVEMA